jgi:hypothetical protein
MSAKEKDVAGCLEVLFKRLDKAKLARNNTEKSGSERALRVNPDVHLQETPGGSLPSPAR